MACCDRSVYPKVVGIIDEAAAAVGASGFYEKVYTKDTLSGSGVRFTRTTMLHATVNSLSPSIGISLTNMKLKNLPIKYRIRTTLPPKPFAVRPQAHEKRHK
jgi:hypothetical protein